MRRSQLIATLLIVILAGSANCFAFTSALVARQDETIVTEQEKKEVQEFAQRFVQRIMKTRDVGTLIPEFFLSDFTNIPKQDYYEKVAPELYAKLSKQERVRLFVAQENLGYIITLEVMTQQDVKVNADSQPFEKIFSPALSRKFNRLRLVEGTAKFTNRGELLRELSRLEKALIEARPILKRKNLEQSAEFLSRLRRFEQDSHLGYSVRGSVIDEEAKREVDLSRFATGQKIFRVETPILIGLIVVKDRGRLKILTLGPADNE